MPEHIKDGRIVVDEVVKLWDKWGVQPRRLSYLSYKSVGPCGCLVGILLVEACGGVRVAFDLWKTSDMEVSEHVVEKIGLDLDYVEELDREFTWSYLNVNKSDGAEVARKLVELKGGLDA